MSDEQVAAANRRGSERVPFHGKVTVQFAEQSIVGPGQNVSGEGVFFVAEGVVRVQVLVAGEVPRVGEVVRVQAMGEGQIGIAVKFLP